VGVSELRAERQKQKQNPLSQGISCPFIGNPQRNRSDSDFLISPSTLDLVNK